MVVTDIDDKNEQMWVKIKTSNLNYNMCIVYGRHESRCKDEKIDEWFYKLESSVAKWTEEPTIIIGDMNAHIGNDERGIEGNHSELNKNGKWWRDLIERRQMILLNNTNICSGKWTRKSSTGNKSILDLIVCNEHMCDFVKKMHIDEDEKFTISRFRKVNGKTIETPSDHNPIVLELTGEGQSCINKDKVWRITEEKLKDFKQHTDINPMKEKWEPGGDVNKKYKRWFKQLKGFMYRFFTRATTKKKKTHSNTIKKKIREKNLVRKEIVNMNNLEQCDEELKKELDEKLGEMISNIETAISRERKEKISQRMNRITSKQSTATNEIWKVRSNVLVKPNQKMAIEDKNGKLLDNKEAILLRHNEYYKSLLQTREPEAPAQDLNEEVGELFRLNMKNKMYDHESINLPLTEAELDEVIKKLKVRKCPGRDEITTEILKSAGKELKSSLLQMFNWFWSEEIISEELLKIHIKTIYKGKGKTSSLSNHRGIFLGSEIIKTYEKLIYNRILAVIEMHLSEFQAGGRPKRNISDHVFILRSIMQHYKYINKELLIEFLDLIKAFDKMSLKHILNELWRCNVRGKIWRIIYIINNHSNISIKTAMGNSPEFQINESLKQGSVLATSLAAMHTDSITRIFENEGMGIMYGSIRLNCLLFQDDIIKIETSIHNLNKSNEMITHFQQLNLMEFHPDKSKYMTTQKSVNNNNKIILGNTKLQETDEYTYLGDSITPDGRLKETLELRSKSCTAVVAELNAIIEETVAENILIDAVLTYHHSIVLTKLCLNAETWNMNKTELSEMERIQNKAIKRMLRLPQGTPSFGLRAELGILSIESVIAKKKLSFLHRVLNQPDSNITKRVLLEQIKLPEETWLSNTIETCQKLEVTSDLMEIKGIPIEVWKKQVMKAVNRYEDAMLMKWAQQSKKYKSANLSVCKKKYINYLPPALAMMVLKTRIGMVEVKTNFKNMFADTTCRKCHSEEEDLQHILQCGRSVTSENQDMMSDVVNIINNIEDEEDTTIKVLAEEIKKVMEEIPLVTTLESVLQEATSDDEDML